MILIAFATPALVVLATVLTRIGTIRPLRRSRLALLFFAGPANLILWFVFNGYLDRVGHRSIFGLAFAAVIFIALGFGLGIFGARGDSAGAESTPDVDNR